MTLSYWKQLILHNMGLTCWYTFCNLFSNCIPGHPSNIVAFLCCWNCFCDKFFLFLIYCGVTFPNPMQYNSLLTVADVFSSPLNSITRDIGSLSSWIPIIAGMFLCVRVYMICASFTISLVLCIRHCFSTTRTFNLLKDFKMHRPYEPCPSINSFSLIGWSSDGSIKLTVANLLLGGPDFVFLSLIWNKVINRRKVKLVS